MLRSWDFLKTPGHASMDVDVPTPHLSGDGLRIGMIALQFIEWRLIKVFKRETSELHLPCTNHILRLSCIGLQSLYSGLEGCCALSSIHIVCVLHSVYCFILY